jgi:hypothetical protein
MKDSNNPLSFISEKDRGAVRGENGQGLVRLICDQAVCAFVLDGFLKCGDNLDSITMDLLGGRHRRRPAFFLEQALKRAFRAGVSVAGTRRE